MKRKRTAELGDRLVLSPAVEIRPHVRGETGISHIVLGQIRGLLKIDDLVAPRDLVAELTRIRDAIRGLLQKGTSDD